MTLIKAAGLLLAILPDQSGAMYLTDYDEYCYIIPMPAEYEIIGETKDRQWTKCRHEKYQVNHIDPYKKPDNPNPYQLRSNWRAHHD